MARSIFGKRIFRLGSVSSTQDVLKGEFQVGAREGTIAVAMEQTRGRGRQNRVWDSASGKGLWVSVIIQPDGPENLWGLTSLWAGLAIQSALSQICQTDEPRDSIQLRWPNDLMWRDKKLGGILAEVARDMTDRQAVILGIGINVSQSNEDFPPHLRQSSISLLDVTGDHCSTEAVLEQLILSFEDSIQLLKPVQPEDIKKAWLPMAWALNEDLRITSGEQIHVGTFFGLGLHGEIGLRTSDGAELFLATSDKIEKVNPS